MFFYILYVHNGDDSMYVKLMFVLNGVWMEHVFFFISLILKYHCYHGPQVSLPVVYELKACFLDYIPIALGVMLLKQIE